MPNFKETIELIDEFVVLPEGWHYGEGGALSVDKIETAKLWIKFFKVAGFSRFNAFPGLNNEIRLRVYHNNLMFEVFFETDNSIDIAIERGEEVLRYIEGATPSQIKDNITYFINELCLMSVPSIIDTSTLKKTNLQPNFLPKGTMAAFQFSTTNAPLELAKRYANISTDFTRLSLQPRLHTTLFQMEQFLRNAISLQNHQKAVTNATETFLVGIKDISAK